MNPKKFGKIDNHKQEPWQVAQVRLHERNAMVVRVSYRGLRR